MTPTNIEELPEYKVTIPSIRININPAPGSVYEFWYTNHNGEETHVVTDDPEAAELLSRIAYAPYN